MTTEDVLHLKLFLILVFRINKLFCARKDDFFGRVFEWASQGWCKVILYLIFNTEDIEKEDEHVPLNFHKTNTIWSHADDAVFDINTFVRYFL